MDTTILLQALLGANAAGMLALALAYLSRRRLPWLAAIFWVLVALFPVVGPFLVILCHPGRRNRRPLRQRPAPGGPFSAPHPDSIA